MNTKRLIAIAAMAGWALALSAGCTAAADNDPTPVTHFKITPASGTQARATATAPATPASQQTPGSGGGTITLSAKNATLKFDQEKLTASAGLATIVFDNQDSGVPHNVHVFEGSDAKGKSVGASALESGPVKQELQLTLAAGSYFYQCDVHPTTMKGTLTVQ
jgi:plastocyanin